MFIFFSSSSFAPDQEDADELERHSLVSDYEEKLVKKKEEVLQLLKERDELRSTHKQLLSLQKKMNVREVSAVAMHWDCFVSVVCIHSIFNL